MNEVPRRWAERRGWMGAALVGVVLLFGACDGSAPGGPGAAVAQPTPGEVIEGSAPGAPVPAPHPLDAPRVATTGLDSVLLAGAFAEAAGLPRLHNLIVARHGVIVAERHYRGPGPGAPANVKSVSKSVLSALIGIAVARGDLEGPDQTIAPFFPAHVRPADDPVRGSITVGNLLSMQAGLESTSSRNYGRWVSSRDWVGHALTRPMVEDPGGRMIYSTGSSHVLSALLTRASGQTTHAFARDHLAGPLGIRIPPWPRDPQGIFFGGNDTLLSPRDLVAFGELYRNGGEHRGRVVVPESWVRDSWVMRTRSNFNRTHQYGLGWWGRDSGEHAVRFAWGYGGQFVFVVPSLELTVVFTSDPVSPREGPHNRAIHSLLDEYLVPAAVRGAHAAGE